MRPERVNGNRRIVGHTACHPLSGNALLIHIRVELKTQNIEGVVVFVMNSTSYEDMLHAVNRFITKIG